MLANTRTLGRNAAGQAASTASLAGAHLSAPQPPTQLVRRRRVTTQVCQCSSAPSDACSSSQPQPADTWGRGRFMELLSQKRQSTHQPGTAAAQEPEARGPGEVFLVGTGPGDPGLLTLRAVQLMRTADVVLYDRLVSEDILQLVHPGARMVYVGKEAGFHTTPQDQIHEMLLEFAEAGACVVRLKGGDPYVFGRGGEEVQYLQQRGVEVRCVPGITAASGICAELGIPMTHRGLATSVRFLTGHAREGGDAALEATIAAAADPYTTLVVYMGLSTLPALSQQLRDHGMPADLPAVAVERGTTARQRVVYGTIGDLYERTQAAKLRSPTLIVVGEVVALAHGWEAWHAAGRPVGESIGAGSGAARLALPNAMEAMGAVFGSGGAVVEQAAEMGVGRALAAPPAA